MELQFATVTWPVPAVWGVGLVVLLIGFFIGFLDSNIRTNKKIVAAEVQAEAKIREAENKMILASQEENASQKTDDPGLLRLKKENAHYTLEMDGRILNKPPSSEEKKRLIELITIFRPWLDGSPAPAVERPAAPAQPAPTPAPVQVKSSHSMPPIATVTTQTELDKSIRTMSIVNQIDTVLQARLTGTPLEKAGIRLQESPEGGVEVIVGVEKFPTVDDVRDAAIKREIRAAIAEWEDKYVPGAR